METFWNLTAPVFATLMLMIYTTPDLEVTSTALNFVGFFTPLHFPFDFLVSTLLLLYTMVKVQLSFTLPDTTSALNVSVSPRVTGRRTAKRVKEIFMAKSLLDSPCTLR